MRSRTREGARSRAPSWLHHEGIGDAIAEALLVLGRPDGDRRDEIEEETVDDAHDVAHDRGLPVELRAVLLHDADADRALAQRPPELRLEDDVVPETDQQPEKERRAREIEA